MPNVIVGGRRLIIDTASGDVVLYDELRINEIQWVGYTDATHTVTVKDKDGRIVWRGNGNTDLSPISAGGSVGRVSGLIVDTLGSGELIVYLE